MCERQNEDEKVMSQGIWELETSGSKGETQSVVGIKIKMLAHIKAGNIHP